MAERRPLVIVTGRVQELPAGDIVPGASAAALKLVYTNETLTIPTNTQVVGNELTFLGTGGLVVEGTGRLVLV